MMIEEVDPAAAHRGAEELERGISEVLRSPKDAGPLEMIVRRPATGEREELLSGRLDLDLGLVGDNWRARGSPRTEDGSAHPDMQLNLMSSRAIALIAGSRDRWSLAGDQLFLDLDLSHENLPPGQRLSIGAAVIEITPVPHLGCKKFTTRFGLPAMLLVNSEAGRQIRMRGVNARVLVPGEIHKGDLARKV